MSGGAEQADILSVLSLVKERWKVVSGVFSADNGPRVRPLQPHRRLSPAHPPAPQNNNSLFIRQCPSPFFFALPLKVSHLRLGQFGVASLRPGRAAAAQEI